MKKLVYLSIVVAVLFSFVAACAAPTPEVVEKEVIVEKEVPVTVEVEKEKIVEKPVVQTVVVEKEKVVEKEVVVTPTPKPVDERLGLYGLKPGKPYEGTELNILICCPTCAQFHSFDLKDNEEFYELTGITVNWGEVPYGAFQEKLVSEATAASDTYDLFAFTDAWGIGLKETYMVPLDVRIEGVPHLKDYASDYPSAYIDACKGVHDGKMYGLPLRGHPFMLFYRKDIFEDLGLEAPTTWAEMEEVSKIIKEKTDLDPVSVYYGVHAGQNIFWWEAYLWSNGGDIFDENWKPIFNNELGVEATDRYVGLLKKGYTSPGAVGFNEQEANEEMIQGRAAMFTGWWWMYSRLTDCERAAEGVCENIGFAPVPGWEGKGPGVSYGHVWPMGINKYSKNVEAAWEYLKWINYPAVGKAVVTDKSAPEIYTNVATRLSVLADPEVNALNNGLPAVGAEILETARTNPLIPEWLEVMSILEVAINDVASGADTKATLDQAVVDVEAVMERAGYYK